MNTETLLLTDLLDCGYADISMLDILYSPLAEDIGMESADILKENIEGGLNGILYETYFQITLAIADRLEDLLQEYTNAKDKEDTELYNMLETKLKKKQITLIEKEIRDMENSYPFCNYLDTHFQNTLDQTLDSDGGVDYNCKLVLEYILDTEE